MKNKKLIRFVESLVLLPMVTMSGSMGPIPEDQTNVAAPSTISSQKFNIQTFSSLAFNQVANPEETAKALEALKLKMAKEAKAEAIDSYFRARNMPLVGTGMKMVLEAEKNELDWRLLPAIAVRESTGGKHDCIKVPNNPFGWGSCKIGFKSNDAAIETVARNLGGNNPNTAHHYDEKTTIQILRAYNPPSIVLRYAQQVISIMDTIGVEDEAVTTVAII